MHLSFQLDQSSGTAQAGDYLTGKLIISASKQIKGTSIQLYFRGKEYTEVQQEQMVRREVSPSRHHHHCHGGDDLADRVFHDDHTELRTERVTEYAKHEIFRVDMPVPNQHTFMQNGYVMPGHHEVPFQIQLPSHIPSTMSMDRRTHVSHLHCKGSIEYALRAKVTGSGIFKDYQGTQVVRVVAQTNTVEATPYVVPPKSQKVKAGMFFNQGEMTFGAKVTSTTLVPGQQPKIHLALVNESKTAIQEVKMELREFITIAAHGYSETIENILCVQRFPQSFFADSQKMGKEKVAVNRRDANSRQRSYQRVLDTLNNDDNRTNQEQWCNLPAVPHDAHESFQGANIRIAHDLRVKLKTKKFVSSPEFDVDVQIVHGTAVARAPSPKRATSPKRAPSPKRSPSPKRAPMAALTPIAPPNAVAPSAPSTAAGYWTCGTCTFAENPQGTAACTLCGASDGTTTVEIPMATAELIPEDAYPVKSEHPLSNMVLKKLAVPPPKTTIKSETVGDKKDGWHELLLVPEFWSSKRPINRGKSVLEANETIMATHPTASVHNSC